MLFVDYKSLVSRKCKKMIFLSRHFNVKMSTQNENESIHQNMIKDLQKCFPNYNINELNQIVNEIINSKSDVIGTLATESMGATSTQPILKVFRNDESNFSLINDLTTYILKNIPKGASFSITYTDEERTPLYDWIGKNKRLFRGYNLINNFIDRSLTFSNEFYSNITVKSYESSFPR
jgi:hypothetical protein